MQKQNLRLRNYRTIYTKNKRVINIKQSMIQQQKVIPAKFQDDYRHYSITLNFNSQNDTLTIQVQNTETMERYSETIDHNYLQGIVHFNCFSAVDLKNIHQYLVNNFNRIVFKDNGIFQFIFRWGVGDQLRENLVQIRLTKHNISPLELASLKIKKIREERNRLEDRLKRKIEKSKKQREKHRRKLDSQGQRIKRQLQEQIHIIKREQDQQNNIIKVLEEMNLGMRRELAEQFQRINKQHQYDKRRIMEENQQLRRELRQIATQVENIQQKVQKSPISHHAGNTHNIYYKLEKTSPKSAKITREGEEGGFNYVNATEILPGNKAKYSIKINHTKEGKIMIGFCTIAGLGSRNFNGKRESFYYECAGFFSLGEEYIQIDSLSRVEDVVDCEADLEAGYLRWRKNETMLRQFPIPQCMIRKGLYFSLIMRSLGDQIEVSV